MAHADELERSYVQLSAYKKVLCTAFIYYTYVMIVLNRYIYAHMHRDVHTIPACEPYIQGSRV